jgi:putative flippase GtrA
MAPVLEANWTSYDHYGYALIAVVGTFAAVAAIQTLIKSTRFSAWTQSLHGVAPPFINIIGVLFGLTIAFLANDTWSAHDRATQSVYKEADALHSMVVLSQSLPAALQGSLGDALVGYALASADEWHFLAQRTTSPEAVKQADALLTLIASNAFEKTAGVNVQALMLRKVSEICGERDQRVALSQTHVNPLKWLGMGFLGLLTLLSVAVVHVDRPRAALVATLLFALAAAPTAAIVLIQGNPFQQPTDVTAAPIKAAVNRLQAR